LNETEQIRSLLEESRSVVFFGGAGTSTESNIPDFRSESGLYHTKSQGSFSPEEMLSRSFFLAHPEEFYEFYKSKMIYRSAKPNRAHDALAELEKQGKLTAVVTQNIDGLHQAAGSRRVLELHGSVHRNRCMGCGKDYDLDAMLGLPGIVPHCEACGGIVKPEVTLYEENLDMEVLNEAVEAIAGADMLIVGGTSLTVNPAAGLVRYYRGDKLVLINKSDTPYDRYARLTVRDSIGKVLGDAVFGGQA